VFSGMQIWTIGIHQYQIAHAHAAAHHVLRGAQHDRRDAERNQRALSDVQRGQRALIRSSPNACGQDCAPPAQYEGDGSCCIASAVCAC
jgi:hypothetical protein